ncbi:MAG: prepilin-type N-terminal cleavage/methylation domain-containing protein [Blastochloris sp.]|nr:prepilin-type N-terminal cleavage/methylation domain-containing protein [Blastochloris sp.]
MKRSPGFSLVELMASMTVLVVITLIMTAVISLCLNAWKDGLRNVDNFTKARLAMDTMARDIRSSILGDTPSISSFQPFKKKDGTDEISFLTEFSGLLPVSAGLTKGSRSLSRTTYEVNFTDPDPKKRGLRRIEYGFDYASPHSFSQYLANNQPDPDRRLYPEGNAVLIGPGICLLYVRFQDDTGRISRSHTPAQQLIYINVLVIDERSIVLLDQIGRLDTVVSRFTTGVETSDNRPVVLWNSTLQDSDFFASLPVDTRKGIRIFERAVPLP